MTSRSTIQPLARILLAAAAGAVCAAPPAHAQSGQPGSPKRLSPSNLERVEQTIGDVSPLAVNPRNLDRDLRNPVGFSAVYRIPPGSRYGKQGAFVRFDGGLAAVFPQSVYMNSRKGLVTPVPPGTVFYIGGIPEPLPEPPPAESPLRNNLEAVSRYSTSATDGPILRMATTAVSPSPVQPVAQASPPDRGVFSDDAYRRARVAQLLETAAAQP